MINLIGVRCYVILSRVPPRFKKSTALATLNADVQGFGEETSAEEASVEESYGTEKLTRSEERELAHH